MCGCSNNTITVRTFENDTVINKTIKKWEIKKFATLEDLNNLAEHFPTEFVLATYDNGNNFRMAKSSSGKLKEYGFLYYGEFVGKQILHVHKNDLTHNVIKI